MDLSYGARLRLQRERKRVTLGDIVEQTKIKLSLLEGLERDDVSQWPAGIYRRSYFRAYAQAIGLDPVASVREFLERHPDPLEELATAPETSSPESTSRWPTTRLRYLIDSAVGARSNRRFPPADPTGAPPAPRESRMAATPALDEAAGSRSDSAGNLDLSPVPRPEPAPAVDFSRVARLCTRLGRVVEAHDVAAVLDEAAVTLDAAGLILWLWDARSRSLAATLAHGYSDELLRQLPHVSADSDNAIATAFRSGETEVVRGSDLETGAVVVPVLTPDGCAAVLALELRAGRERLEPVRAAATILAAQLATLVAAPAFAHAVSA